MLNLSKMFRDGRLFLGMLTLCFAEGAAPLAGADSGAAAVIAGATGAEGEGGEGAPAEGAEATGEGTEGTEGAQVDPAKPSTEQQAAPQIDGRQVPAAIRKHLAEVKATNPALAKELNDYVWGYKNLKADIAKNFPEGLKEAIALKTTVEELTGADTVEQFCEEVQDYRMLDQQFISGDPQFIQTAVAKFPDGFKKLMPHMLDTWASVDPDAYDRRMAGVIVATLNQNQFGHNLARAIDFLEMLPAAAPDKVPVIVQKVAELIGEGQKALEGWNKFAQSKPPVPQIDPNAEANAKRQRELDQREERIFAGNVTKDLDVFSASRIAKELAQLKKNVPESARPVFDKQVIDAVWAKMRAESNFTPKFKALMANKDHAGVLKFLETKSDGYYADAVEQAYKRLYGTTKFAGAPRPKPATGAPGTAGAPTQKPAAGWAKVSPDDRSIDAQIDRRQTSERDIVIAKKAVLKDGRKVYWGTTIPTA